MRCPKLRFDRARPMNSLLLAFCAYLLISFARAQAPPRWAGRFQTAYEQLGGGNVDAAIHSFEGLWQYNPRDFKLAHAIGTALDSYGHHKEATGWYKKALKLDPQFAPAHNNLALNYITLGERQKALLELQEATRLEPRNQRAVYNLGLIHLQMHHFPEAARAFERAHRLEPANPDPLARLAYARFRAGRKAEGLRAVEALLRLAGNRLEHLRDAVRLLNEAGLYHEALEDAREAEEDGASSADLLYEEARALFYLGQYKESAEELLRVKSAKGSDLEYYLLLGSAQALGDDLPGAVSTLQTAVRISPQRPEPYYRLALVFMEGFRDQDAREVLTTGLERVPNSTLLLNTSGLVEESAGRYQDAIDYLRKSLEVMPKQPTVWDRVGELEGKLQQFGEAEKAYKTAISLGASPETSVKYAELLYRLQSFSEAEKVLRGVIEQDRRATKAYAALGKLYNSQQRYKEAEQMLRRAIVLDPKDHSTHYALGMVLQKLGRAEEAKVELTLAAGEKHAARRESEELLKGVLVPVTRAADAELTQSPGDDN